MLQQQMFETTVHSNIQEIRVRQTPEKRHTNPNHEHLALRKDCVTNVKSMHAFFKVISPLFLQSPAFFLVAAEQQPSSSERKIV